MVCVCSCLCCAPLCTVWCKPIMYFTIYTYIHSLSGCQCMTYTQWVMVYCSSQCVTGNTCWEHAHRGNDEGGKIFMGVLTAHSSTMKQLHKARSQRCCYDCVRIIWLLMKLWLAESDCGGRPQVVHKTINNLKCIILCAESVRTSVLNPTPSS